MRSSVLTLVHLSTSLGYFCFKHYLHAFLTAQKASSPFRLPQSIVDSLISKTSFWYGGLLSGLSLLIEERRRHGELAMYVLPKGLESAWTSAKGHGWVFKTGKYGDSMVSDEFSFFCFSFALFALILLLGPLQLMAIGMGMVMVSLLS